MTDKPTAARSGQPNWLPLAGSIAFVTLMTVSTALKLQSQHRDTWFVVSTLLWAVGIIVLFLCAVLTNWELRVTRRTRSLRRDYPTAYIVEILNDPGLSVQLQVLVRRLQRKRVRFPSRGTQTLVVDSTGIQLFVGSANYRRRAAVPVDAIERLGLSATRVGQYQIRSVPSVDVDCRISGIPLTLSMHLSRFVGVWPLFLTETRNAEACQRMLVALGRVGTPSEPSGR
ncbi:hypothetical protein ABH923_001237 [Leifsonia sp. EB41]|uniref:hypothetical protein n=1 Tax=Leifsonia sp. EB41 TaxID=3156260 RepID=UPI003512BCF7